MKKIIRDGAQAAFLLVLMMTSQLAFGSVEPTGMLTLEPVYERSCVAVRVPLADDEALAGVRWYNNDDQTVFPAILVASGISDVPPIYDDGLVLAQAVGGQESGWSEVSFSEAVASETGTLYVIFQLPANESGVEPGVGPGFGHIEADSSSCVFLSGDGDEWIRLVTDYQLLVDPVYTLKESGMATLKCSIGGPEFAVELVEEEEVIERTELLRPCPNPFNPTTRIAFTVKNSGDIRLSIYDVRGRWVRDLENGYRETGRYHCCPR